MSPPPSAQVFTTLPHKQDASPSYRQSKYQDGRIIQIHESRRSRSSGRTGISSLNFHRQHEATSPTHSRHDDNVILPSIEKKDLSKPHMEPEQRTGQWPIRHVMGLSTAPLRKTKPVIIQKPISFHNDRTIRLGSISTDTPPPTPKLRRLPTPDLPDIVDAPFCDCPMEMPISKMHCPTCTCETGLER